MSEKFVTKGCCGRVTISFKIKEKVSTKLISFLKENGFKEHEHFTKSGMLYMETKDIIISGQIGNSSLHVKCRLSNCDSQVNDLELYLSKYEKSCL